MKKKKNMKKIEQYLEKHIPKNTQLISFKFGMPSPVYGKNKMCKFDRNQFCSYRDMRCWKRWLSGSCKQHTCVSHVFLGCWHTTVSLDILSACYPHLIFLLFHIWSQWFINIRLWELWKLTMLPQMWLCAYWNKNRKHSTIQMKLYRAAIIYVA